MENTSCISAVHFVLYAKNCLQLFSDNPGQKCWEGSITLEIAPSPLSMLDFLGRIWWLIFHYEPHEQSQHWIGGGGTRACHFPNSTANSSNNGIRCEVKWWTQLSQQLLTTIVGFKMKVEVIEIKSLEINSAALTVIYALENNAQHNKRDLIQLTRISMICINFMEFLWQGRLNKEVIIYMYIRK